MCSTYASTTWWSVAPDTSIGAVIPVVLSAAMTVVLAGTLRGSLACACSPRGARAYQGRHHYHSRPGGLPLHDIRQASLDGGERTSIVLIHPRKRGAIDELILADQQQVEVAVVVVVASIERTRCNSEQTSLNIDKAAAVVAVDSADELVGVVHDPAHGQVGVAVVIVVAPGKRRILEAVGAAGKAGKHSLAIGKCAIGIAVDLQDWAVSES